jgi:LiaF transmembrane domain
VNRKQASSFTTGLLLVVIGLVLLSTQLHWFGPLSMATLWPLVLFVMGIGHMARAESEHRWRAGLWWFFLGTIFLLHTTRTLMLHDSWPLFIVWIGISILVGKNCEPERNRIRPGSQASETPDVVVPRQPQS